MSLRIDNYNYDYKVISIAYSEDTKKDLLCNVDLEFIYITKDKTILFPDNVEIELVGNEEEIYGMSDYDVCEIWPNGRIYMLYDNCSIDNYFFVTGRCNSNCIMCPSAEYSRQHGNSPNVDRLIEIAKHIPVNAVHLTITGGEPFLAGAELLRFVLVLKEKFENTDFLFLTNGRIFAVKEIVDLFVDNMPNNTIVGIPLHGATEETHDLITQTKGSFFQTFAGIRKLISQGVRVELRIVVSALNYLEMNNISELIINEFRGVSYVSIMAMEMTGSAFVNRDRVWIPYSIAAKSVEKSIDTLLRAGIDVRLYNFPLCTVRKAYWTLCEKSISPDKIRYSSVCDNCTVKSACGGVFNGTIGMEKKELTPQI